jgi:UDP-N-acetylmuramoyl-tripeptide--D-alanyl-D-alanine ligase
VSALTFEGFIEATRAVADAATDLRDRPFMPCTDTRLLQRGETFVCLRGPHFDGHAFIGAAVERGAIAVVADARGDVPAQLPIPVLRVSDTKAAYMLGAAAARRLVRCSVIGVTGSVGKTTVTAMCAQLLERHRRVLATPHNENNEIGVSKLCYELASGVAPDVAVVEMGARGPGQIAQLVDIASPEIGILTNVGEAHLEFFEDRAALAKTKWELFGKGARPVLNAADEWSRSLAASAGVESEAVWVRLCGDPRNEGLTLESGVPRDGRVPLTFGASHAYAPWHLLGEHHLRDALLAAGAAILAGLTFEEAAAGFGSLRLPPGRFEMHALPSRAVVVYDAYNASPTSMAHALLAFAQVPAARRIAVLGSMAELGADAPAQHEATGAAAARAGVDALYCGGAFAQALADGARKAGMDAGRVEVFASNEDVATLLRERLGEGDAVLLKGSRVQKMEEILASLLAVETSAS